ncbi:MAG: hypothetical protein ABIJ21_01725 [Nanoarchaeota archaeon]
MLRKKGKQYTHQKYAREKIKPGTIVFIERNTTYPAGHYLLKTSRGWMNPWINYPKIKPAKAGFQQKIPGKILWIIFETKRHYI